MTIKIIGYENPHHLYCTGSLTKMLTSYVILSHLAAKYDLNKILDDDGFFDDLAVRPQAKHFLQMFQHIIGSSFSLRDVCTFYNGLPYTFGILPAELEFVDQGHPYKGHSILDEKILLEKFRDTITMIDPNHSKFHYSEIAIIFLGYFMEQVFELKIEELYQQYLITPFALTESQFSRVMPPDVLRRDLSYKYDYPAIGLVNHGYFCYSNGFFTTLHDEQRLIEQLLISPVFAVMADLKHARAASNTLVNGLTLEIRLVGDDIIYGYEGLSYSGCNIWAYSTKQSKGFLTFTDDEDAAYPMIYDHFGYNQFDKAPAVTQEIYQHFLKTEHYKYLDKTIPEDFIGDYLRVDINDSALDIIFRIDARSITIRNPEMVTYDIICDDHDIFRTTCKDHMHGIKIGLHQAKSGRRYIMFDGALYRKI